MHEHARPRGRIVRRVSRHRRADPRRGAEAVVRGGVRSRVRLRQAGSAEARPAVAARGRIEPPCIGRVLTCSLEEDHVMHDRRPLWLDDRAGHVRVLREVRLEQEAVVVVQPADRCLREIRARRGEGHGLARRSRRPADGLHAPSRAEARAAADPAGDQVLLGGSQDPPRLPEVGR